MVLGARPISVASRYSGASPEFAEIIPEIVNLGDHLGRSGYCPVPIGCLPVADGAVRWGFLYDLVGFPIRYVS